MDHYTLTGEFYLHPTPSGAYYAASRPTRDPARTFLQRLLREPETPLLTAALVQDWMQMDEADALEFIYRLQSSGFVQGLPMRVEVPQERIEALLPPLLAQLSDEGRAILAEKRGLYLGTAGFAHEAAEELAALGADLAVVHERHARLLHGNLRLHSDGWGMVNASGYSELGFWPLYFGDDYFILIIGGMPRFNQEAFTSLIWTLGVRYGGQQ
ncbi:hypothetical protein C7444_11556 [Sphaerotilus hippei]|uniref:Uncharacterized protein n=1 Tax=Sphaerotilus hippei TaxID=744406 RepID=A0A318H4T9_9BURK|nr:hypothetical protein [Sphaerotilus hippei]PXW94162.1 hypothetical protein C7444_11556 [Sphaerotilus hippei]